MDGSRIAGERVCRNPPNIGIILATFLQTTSNVDPNDSMMAQILGLINQMKLDQSEAVVVLSDVTSLVESDGGAQASLDRLLLTYNQRHAALKANLTTFGIDITTVSHSLLTLTG